jgi:hypothetical protein
MGRVIIGPIGTSFEKFREYYKTIGWSDYWGADHENRMSSNARWELLERVNMRLRGEDPGKPFHWKGM